MGTVRATYTELPPPRACTNKLPPTPPYHPCNLNSVRPLTWATVRVSFYGIPFVFFESFKGQWWINRPWETMEVVVRGILTFVIGLKLSQWVAFPILKEGEEVVFGKMVRSIWVGFGGPIQLSALDLNSIIFALHWTQRSHNRCLFNRVC